MDWGGDHKSQDQKSSSVPNIVKKKFRIKMLCFCNFGPQCYRLVSSAVWEHRKIGKREPMPGPNTTLCVGVKGDSDQGGKEEKVRNFLFHFWRS